MLVARWCRYMEAPHETVIRQSANRPNQILGGDRELVIGSGVVAVMIAFSMANWEGLVIGVCLWLICVLALQRMGKADPMMRHIYFRHIRHEPFYPAKSGLYRREIKPRPRNWR